MTSKMLTLSPGAAFGAALSSTRPSLLWSWAPALLAAGAGLLSVVLGVLHPSCWLLLLSALLLSTPGAAGRSLEVLWPLALAVVGLSWGWPL